MSEKMPKKILPEIKISKQQTEELKAISAITKLLADDPKMTSKIVESFVEATRVDPKDRVVASMELQTKVTNMIAEKLKEIPVETIEKLWPRIIRNIWRIRNIQIWDWGPYNPGMGSVDDFLYG